MTKTDLVNAIAEKTGLTKADAARSLDAMMESVEEGLKKEGKVTLTGFCTFVAKKKKQLLHVIQEQEKLYQFLLKWLLQLKLVLS